MALSNRVLAILMLVSTGLAAHAGSFTTNRFDATVTMAADETTTVVDTITVTLTQPQAGIVLTLPAQGFKLVSAEQSSDGRRFDPVHAAVESDGIWRCHIDDTGSLAVGKRTYRVTYRSAAGLGFDRNTGVFKWEMLPSNWPTPIENGKVTIETPEREWIQMCAFDEIQNGRHNAIAVANKYGAETHNDDFSAEGLDYNIWGATLTSRFPTGANLNAAVFTRLGSDPLKAYPKDPFDWQRAVPKSIVWTILATPLVLAALSVLWIRATTKRT